MSTVTLRVRPGFTHGAQKEYKGGDLLFVDAAEAAMLLAAFGDKLEEVAGSRQQVAGSQTEAAEPEAGQEPGAAKSRARRSRA